MDIRGRGLNRLLAVTARLGVAVLLTLVLLELGTRLVAPVSSFDYIPNTYDPGVGIRQIPGARGFIKNPEFAMELRINEAGLRDHDYPLARPAGQRRVLCLGDSFTNGFGVPLAETFAKVSEAELLRPEPGDDSWQVINAGVGATGTAQQVAWFAAEGRAYGAEVVVLTFSPNDFVDNRVSGMWTLSAAGELHQHPAPRSRTLKLLRLTRYIPFYATLFSRSHFVNAVKQRFARRHHARLDEENRSARPDTALARAELELALALIQRLATTCAEEGSDLVVMIVPPLPGSGGVEEQTALLIENLRRRRIEVIDLRATFTGLQSQGIVTNYPLDGHWTGAGHAAAAAALLDWLEEREGLDSPG